MASRATDGSLFTGGERARIKRIGEPIALFLGRLGFSPDALTVAGFGIVLAAAVAAAAGEWVLTAVILIFGTLFDGLDGTLARATGKTSDFGAFLDSTMDRAGEAVIYAGIAAVAGIIAWLIFRKRDTGPRPPRARDVFKLPATIDGFAVVALLRKLGTSPLVKFNAAQKAELQQDIDRVQTGCFGGAATLSPADLKSLAEKWLRQLR